MQSPDLEQVLRARLARLGHTIRWVFNLPRAAWYEARARLGRWGGLQEAVRAPKVPRVLGGKKRPLQAILGPNEAVELLAFDIWTEGEAKCDHCYHEITVDKKHFATLGLGKGDLHADYVCCRCSHGVCSTMRAPYVKHLSLEGPVLASMMGPKPGQGT